jgi:GDP-mannose 6-dehydrogenase
VKISVFGLGYVGSVSAACLAQGGHEVIGVDIDDAKLKMLAEGHAPVVEPGLNDLVRNGFEAGKLTVTNDTRRAILDSEISWICVGTPSERNGDVSLVALESVCREIGKALAQKDEYHVVVVRSTVLPGTVRHHVIPWLEAASAKIAGQHFGVCMSPEFLREGTAVADFAEPALTLIGELDTESGNVAAESYSGVSAPVVKTNIEVAEMVKYAGNAFHALKVVFANEIGTLAKAQGIDGREVMELLCRDTQLNISTAYLKPGFAFGGSCLPKDTRALVHRARRLDTETPVLESILSSNDLHVRRAIELVEQTDSNNVGVLGLSFKAGTDDVRESPIVPLIESLVGRGYKVRIYDEDVNLGELIGTNRAFVEREIPHLAALMMSDMAQVVQESDVLVVGNGSKTYREVIHQLGPSQKLIDLVGITKGTGGTLGEYEGICW